MAQGSELQLFSLDSPDLSCLTFPFLFLNFPGREIGIEQPVFSLTRVKKSPDKRTCSNSKSVCYDTSHGGQEKGDAGFLGKAGGARRRSRSDSIRDRKPPLCAALGQLYLRD